MHAFDRRFLTAMISTLLVVFAFSCTPAPAAAQEMRATAENVEFYGGNDVGGAVILFKEPGPCANRGGKTAVSTSAEGEPLWFGCWRDAGGSIQLVWITPEGPRAYLVPKTMLFPGSSLKGGNKPPVPDFNTGGTET